MKAREFLIGIIKVLKYTHRHPINRAFHAIGVILYLWSIATATGHPLIILLPHSPMIAGILWAAGVGTMIAGHVIEGNVQSITPVLIGRLIIRSFYSGRYHRTHGIHLFRL